METKDRDTVYDAVPLNDGHNAETNQTIIENNEEYTIYEAIDENGESVYAQQNLDDPESKDEDENEDEEQEEEQEEENEEAGDWGHVDPAESNSPSRP